MKNLKGTDRKDREVGEALSGVTLDSGDSGNWEVKPH